MLSPWRGLFSWFRCNAIECGHLKTDHGCTLRGSDMLVDYAPVDCYRKVDPENLAVGFPHSLLFVCVFWGVLFIADRRSYPPSPPFSCRRHCCSQINHAWYCPRFPPKFNGLLMLYTKSHASSLHIFFQHRSGEARFPLFSYTPVTVGY